MFRIGICEDEQEDLIYQRKLVEECLQEMGIQAVVVSSMSGEELLLEMEEHGNFHIIFLDIEMSRINGIETASKIRENDYRTLLIFVSAHDNYCKQLINVQPFAFMDKPLQKKELLKILQKAFKVQGQESENYHFRWNRVYYQVNLCDVLYFSSEKRIISITTVEADYKFYGILDMVEWQLNSSEETFLRIHQSWLVNTRYIQECHYEKVVLKNGKELAISKRNRDRIRHWYFKVLKEQMKC